MGCIRLSSRWFLEPTIFWRVHLIMKFYPWVFATGIVKYTGPAREARGDEGKSEGFFQEIVQPDDAASVFAAASLIEPSGRRVIQISV
jgi:hypothetical protein